MLVNLRADYATFTERENMPRGDSSSCDGEDDTVDSGDDSDSDGSDDDAVLDIMVSSVCGHGMISMSPRACRRIVPAAKTSSCSSP
jgi:hypothetical protein